MSWQTNYLDFKNRAALSSLSANELRQKSFAAFEAEGLPSKKDEAWKFTSLSDFKSIEWKLPETEEGLLTHDQMQEVSKQLPSEFLNFVFVNGVLNKTLSDDTEELLQILEATELDFKRDGEHVEARILNLAEAFLKQKIVMTIGKHRVIERPIQFVFVQSSVDSVYLSEKIEINVEENAEVKLLLHSMSFANGHADALNLNINVNCAENSRLTFIQLQNEDHGSFHFSQCHLNLASKAQLNSLALSLGNKLTRNYYSLAFTGERADAQVFGLSVLDTDQHVDNYTYIQHRIGHNQSTQHYKSVLSGSSHSVFRGRVLIAPDAQKANSEQLNNNLLLTRTASADSVPQLEIFADDVKAGHGATVGQLNKDEIFYFLSRGINQYQAVKMLSHGFAAELVYKFENPELQLFLLNALNQKLDRLVQNG